MVGTGKPLEREFSRGLTVFEGAHAGFWWKRWPDFRDFRGSTTKYIPPKAPSDFIALYSGRLYAFECKSTKAKRFSMSWMRSHQLDSLKRIKECGGVSAIIFSTRSKLRSKTKCYFIDVDDYVYIEKEYRNAEYSSIPIEEMAAHGIELPRITVHGEKSSQPAWDLKPLFEPGMASYIEEKPAVKRKGRFGG